MSKPLTDLVSEALKTYNLDKGTNYSFGTSWNKVSSDFNDLVSNYLFPKLNETTLVVKPLGNRFEYLAVEEDNIAQYSEEYVILDAIPVNLNLNKSRMTMLNTNYPKIANVIFGTGMFKKLKFTLNDNYARRNFNTLKDAINYALGVYTKRVSDINVNEESELKAMLIKYATTETKDKRQANDINDLIEKTYIALLNIQNNSSAYNECSKIVNIPYTTQTNLENVLIITNDVVKYQILNTKIANTFNSAGLDITKHIISFDDFNNIYEVKTDITTTKKEVEYLQTLCEHEISVGDVIPKGTLICINDPELEKVNTAFEHIDVKKDFVYIIDENKIKYKRNTKNMLKSFDNPEFNEINHWLHYYTKKTISPFYNNVFIQVK